jgi:hypothetical protein
MARVAKEIGKGMGPGGECVCPDCGHRQPHKRGVPCFRQICPKCGSTMARDEEP